ncbi:MAG TPA: TonB-dependent receptor [Burkholderiaceae bacterium]|nr:TonB-dependent receptor [Burkholderiaceae bacterium]
MLGELAVAAAAWTAALPCAAHQRLEFDIAAGPLGPVLLEISQVAGIVVSYRPSLVAQRQAPAVRGSYTLMEALALATQEAGLKVETTASGAVTLVVAEAPAQNPTGLRPSDGQALPAAGAAQNGADFVLQRVVVQGSARPPEDGLKPLRSTSATRTETLLVDLPQSVSVLTGEALDLQGGTTSTQALRYVTGVSSRIDLSGGQDIVPSQLVRGLPALFAISGMGTIRSTLPMDNAFIERIEVPKGPSNVISGVTSFGGRGGAVNLVRKEAGGDPHQQFMISPSSQDGGTLRAEADLAGRATPDLSWRTVAFGNATGRTDGGYTHSGGGGLLGSVRYRGQDVTTTLTLQTDRRRLTPLAASRGTGLRPDGSIAPVEDGQVPPVDAGSRMLLTSADAELGLEWRLMPRWRMTLKTRMEEVASDLRETLPAASAFSFKAQRRATWWNRALQWGLIGDVDAGPVNHQLLLGVDLADWRVRILDKSEFATTPVELLATTPVQEFRTDVKDVKREVLLQDQLRYGNLRVRLSAQASRVPSYDLGSMGTTADNKTQAALGLNWDAGALYRLSSDASVYAGSQYAVETDFIRALGVGSGSVKGSGDPTRTLQFQSGLKLDLLDDRLALTLEGYRTVQINVPNSPNIGVPGRDTLFSITPRRKIEGLELELAGRPWPALDLQMGLSLMRASDLLPGVPGSPEASLYVPAGAIPARSMTLLSRYRLPEGWLRRTSLGVGFRARSSSFAVTPIPAQPGVQLVLPGGAQLDLSLEHMFGPWSVNAFVQNVFDRQLYETQSSPGYIPLEPRRSLGVTATYRLSGLAH